MATEKIEETESIFSLLTPIKNNNTNTIIFNNSKQPKRINSKHIPLIRRLKSQFELFDKIEYLGSGNSSTVFYVKQKTVERALKPLKLSQGEKEHRILREIHNNKAIPPNVKNHIIKSYSLQYLYPKDYDFFIKFNKKMGRTNSKIDSLKKTKKIIENDINGKILSNNAYDKLFKQKKKEWEQTLPSVRQKIHSYEKKLHTYKTYLKAINKELRFPSHTYPELNRNTNKLTNKAYKKLFKQKKNEWETELKSDKFLYEMDRNELLEQLASAKDNLIFRTYKYPELRYEELKREELNHASLAILELEYVNGDYFFTTLNKLLLQHFLELYIAKDINYKDIQKIILNIESGFSDVYGYSNSNITELEQIKKLNETGLCDLLLHKSNKYTILDGFNNGDDKLNDIHLIMAQFLFTHSTLFNNGYIHNDIKNANLMVIKQSEQQLYDIPDKYIAKHFKDSTKTTRFHVKLIDFGEIHIRKNNDKSQSKKLLLSNFSYTNLIEYNDNYKTLINNISKLSFNT